jgi:biopolymer transport protein ExbB/TolQ
MCAGSRSTASRPLRLFGAVLAVAAVVFGLPTAAGAADDPRLEEALREEQEAQRSLGELLQRIETIRAEEDEINGRHADLLAQQEQQESQAAQADAASIERARELYIKGSADPGIAVLTSDSPEEAAEQAQILAFLSSSNRAAAEGASAAGIRTGVAADQVAYEIAQLEERREELEADRAQAEETVQATLAAVEEVRSTIAAEEEARRREEEEARRREEEARAREQAQARAT